jgi:hypothetical protein
MQEKRKAEERKKKMNETAGISKETKNKRWLMKGERKK